MAQQAQTKQSGPTSGLHFITHGVTKMKQDGLITPTNPGTSATLALQEVIDPLMALTPQGRNRNHQHQRHRPTTRMIPCWAHKPEVGTRRWQLQRVQTPPPKRGRRRHARLMQKTRFRSRLQLNLHSQRSLLLTPHAQEHRQPHLQLPHTFHHQITHHLRHHLNSMLPKHEDSF